MAPLPINNTSRMIYEYSWPNGDGNFQIRFNSALVSTADVDNYTLGLLGALDPILSADWTIIGQRFQQQGNTFSLPVAPIGFTSTPTTVQPEAQRPLEVSFQGRSSGGRRASLSIFGARLTVPAIYRIPFGVVTDVDGVISYLQAGLIDGVHVAIDNLSVLWYSYANLNYNSYYERQARR
jgi:hypothetical protein